MTLRDIVRPPLDVDRQAACRRAARGRIAVRPVLLLCAMVVLAGCGGAKLVRHPAAPTPIGSLVQASDGRLAASLDWLIVQNGPGAWARNSDWDEYLVRVRTLVPGAVTVTGASVIDSLGTRLPAGDDRSGLVHASRGSVRRYRSSGLRVEAGLGGATLAAAGVGASYGTASGLAAGTTMGGAYAGALLFTVAAPVFGVAGIMRGVHNGQVNREIGRRHAVLPRVLADGSEQSLDLFFPQALAPQRIEIEYTDATGAHVLAIDTRAALAGLHLPAINAGAH